MDKKSSASKIFIEKAKGIGIVEFTIVMGIIVLLLGVAFILRNISQAQSRDAERISEINIIRASLQFYYLDNGYYPIETEWCSIESNCPNLSGAIKPYLAQIPEDPLYQEGEKRYSYQYRTTDDGLEYKIYTNLEKGGPYELGSRGSFVISSPRS